MLQLFLLLVQFMHLLLEVYREAKVYNREIRMQFAREMRERQMRLRNVNNNRMNDGEE